VFVWAVYDCCRSGLRDQFLLSDDITRLEKNHDEEQKEEALGEIEEATRGAGKRGSQLNHLFVYGCPANSVIKDKNPLVDIIG